MANFVRVGNIDRKDGYFEPNKPYKDDLSQYDLKFPLSALINLLERTNDWYICGTYPNGEQGKNGIFLRLAQSGNAFTFKIGLYRYSIPVKSITEFSNRFIGVFRIED